MNLTTDASISNFLFNGWEGRTTGQYALIILVVFALCFLNEGLIYLKRQRKVEKSNAKKNYVPLKGLDQSYHADIELISGANCLDSFIFALIKVLNYGFMLMAMTFNVWVILVIIVTLPFANFIFNGMSDKK